MDCDCGGKRRAAPLYLPNAISPVHKFLVRPIELSPLRSAIALQMRAIVRASRGNLTRFRHHHILTQRVTQPVSGLPHANSSPVRAEYAASGACCFRLVKFHNDATLVALRFAWVPGAACVAHRMRATVSAASVVQRTAVISGV